MQERYPSKREADWNNALLSKKEAAEWLGISQPTLNRRITDGTIPAFKLGNLVRIKRADLEASLVPCEHIGEV